MITYGVLDVHVGACCAVEPIQVHRCIQVAYSAVSSAVPVSAGVTPARRCITADKATSPFLLHAMLTRYLATSGYKPCIFIVCLSVYTRDA